jgi:methionine-rich copper-binding protein CopC
MKLTKSIFLILGFVLASYASAHTSIKSSIPKNAERLLVSPPSLVLEFLKPVRLIKLELIDSDGRTIDILFKRTNKLSSKFSYELPELSNSKYIVKWMVLGGDSHKMKGDFRFELQQKLHQN